MKSAKLKRFLFGLFASVFAINAIAQVHGFQQVEMSFLTDSSQRAQLSVEAFLTWEEYATYKSNVGASNETVDMVRPVVSNDNASKLDSIISNDLDYLRMRSNLKEK